MARTIYDVAQEAGVAVNTVRKALRDDPSLRPLLRERILSTVKRLDYRPNLVAKALSQRQLNVVPISIIDLQNPYFGALATELSNCLVAKGQEPALCIQFDRLLDLSRSLTTQACIAAHVPATPEQLRRLARGHRVVTIKMDPTPIPNVGRVELEFAPAYRQAVQRCLAEGRQRFALCSWLLAHPEWNPGIPGKFGPVREVLKEAGLCEVLPPGQLGFYSTADIIEYLELHPGSIDTVFCENDTLAAALFNQLAVLGLHLPDDLRIVGCDALQPLAGIWSIHIDVARVAWEAVDLLQELAGNREPAERVVHTTLVDDRGSAFHP